MRAETVIIGAGIAGLACASELASGGSSPVLLEKSRGVGGRCATRRVQGRPVDHGVVFLHGADERFLESLGAVEGAGALPGWPARVHGTGPPCQPEAFRPYQKRLAFQQGVSAFPKHLARGLDVRLSSPVTGLELDGEDICLTLGAAAEGDGHSVAIRCRTAILTAPAVQALSLLAPLASSCREISSACELLHMVANLPCLTLLAGYGAGAPEPPWDVCYPEDSRILQLISHDTAKRKDPVGVTLVCQARPAWSRHRLEDPPEAWSAEILQEAARVAGSWAARPVWTQTQVWSHARTDQRTELASPILLELPSGQRLGLAGESFAPGGGVEAAFTSGLRLARRLLGKEGQ